MTWIKTVPAEEADAGLGAIYAALGALYPPEYRDAVPALVRPDGGTESITAAHSLIPEGMRHAMATFAVLLAPDLPLTRRQHEMIATVVSARNGCFY